MTLFRSWWRLSSSLCMLSLLAATGCNVQVRSWSQQEPSERTVEHRTTLPAGGTLDVDTSSGSITITGTETTECHVVATITARAPSAEEAQELAEQVEIRLEQSSDTLKVRAEKPTLSNNRSISVSYAITTPRRTNVQCHSSYGSLNLADLEGTVNGKTSSGSIEAENIVGATNLDTSYGSVACRRIIGPEVILHSGSGSVTAADIKGTARMDSSYGSVKCERFSDGDLTLKSGSGRITVADAVFGKCEANSSYGPVTGRRLEGDAIKLRSSSGSVELTDGTAKTLDLSSSYGRVRAMQIVTSDLKAHSGSGSIDIVCADACGPELKADVKTSYGSVDFVAPTEFSGRVYLVTHYGSVRTTRPITLTGEITKKKVAGAIGDGQGHLRLETSSGSIQLK